MNPLSASTLENRRPRMYDCGVHGVAGRRRGLFSEGSLGFLVGLYTRGSMVPGWDEGGRGGGRATRECVAEWGWVFTSLV